MPYCPECGTKNDDTARFCKNCGHSLEEVEAPADAAAPVGTAPEPEPAVRTRPVTVEDLDAEPGGERLLWQGHPSRLLAPRLGFSTRYRLTNERLQVIRGFLSRHTEEIELYRVNDIDMSQSFGERIFGLGDIQIEGTDATSPITRLDKIRGPAQVKDLLRAAARAERQRRRVLLRDEV